MKKDNHAYQIFFRYLILLLLGLGNIVIFYEVFKPLTIFPTYYILNLFYDVHLSGISLIIGNYTIEIIEACIAPAAYYLLLMLNLATPMKLNKRLLTISVSFGLLLLLNISRIVVLSIMFINDSNAFDFTHKFLWYGLSTIFVVGIWFFVVYFYKIKEIPLYTDYIYFRKLIKRPTSHRR